jgi:hypothetical protein
LEETLYEIEASGLKRADRSMRIFRSVAIFILEIVFLLGLFMVFDLLAIAIFLLAVILFLPSPAVMVPAKYRITSAGVIHDKAKMIPFKRSYKVRMNEKRRFVSMLHRRRGEFLRLYTPEPSRVLQIVSESISKIYK